LCLLRNQRRNRIVVQSWGKSWNQAREAPQAWATLTKSTLEEAQAEFAITGPFGTDEPDDAGGDDSESLDDF